MSYFLRVVVYLYICVNEFITLLIKNFRELNALLDNQSAR